MWHIVAVMDFAMSAKAADYHARLTDFMTEHVFPAEASYHAYREEKGPNDHTVPPVVEELKVKAKAAGLWNLFLPAPSAKCDRFAAKCRLFFRTPSVH